jgi:hypothetical protein
MKASELRIGNYVNNKSRFDIVTCLEYVTFEDIINVRGQYYECFPPEPIPLNREWLRNLGFDTGGYDLLFWEHPNLPNIDFAGINWADEEFPEYQFLNVEINNNIIKIKYVHQLQNLYFALTGEELVVKA